MFEVLGKTAKNKILLSLGVKVPSVGLDMSAREN